LALHGILRLAPDHYRPQRQPPRDIGILGLVGKPQRMAIRQLVRHPQGQLVLAGGDPIDVERLVPDPGRVAGQQAGDLPRRRERLRHPTADANQPEFGRPVIVERRDAPVDKFHFDREFPHPDRGDGDRGNMKIIAQANESSW